MKRPAPKKFRPRLRLIPLLLILCVLALPIRFADAVTKAEAGLPKNAWLEDITAQLRGIEPPEEPETACVNADDVPTIERLTAEARDHFAEREAALSAREETLAATAADLAAELSRLEALQASITQELESRERLAQADIDKLVVVYSAMKPDDAARLLDKTDIAVLFQILDTMDGRLSAPILAEMDAAKVNELTEQYALRHVMTADRPLSFVAFEQ